MKGVITKITDEVLRGMTGRRGRVRRDAFVRLDGRNVILAVAC